MKSPTATLTVNLGIIRENYRTICKKLGGVESSAVVKANAYGHGASEVAIALKKEGCSKFFVATLDEALELKSGDLKEGIHVFHGCDERNASYFSGENITPVINDFSQLEAWKNEGARLGKKLPAIVHIDTGMNRLGFAFRDFKKAAAENFGGLDVQYIMSHLACADRPEHELNQIQLRKFKEAMKLAPNIKGSLANSSAVFMDKEYYFDLARPGVAVYGMNPTYNKESPVKQAITLTAEIIQLRTVEEDSTVSYGATEAVKKGTRLATVGIGYADGIQWRLAGKFTGYINDIPAKLVGRVTMDLLVFDVSNVPEAMLKTGTEIELLGSNNLVDDVADSLGTISYEILTRLGKRLKRVYVEQEHYQEQASKVMAAQG